MKILNLYILIFSIICSSCQKREPNIYIFDDDLFDVSIDLPFNWKLVDGDNDHFCIVGWCKKDVSSNDYLNAVFDSSNKKKGEKPNFYNMLVEFPMLNRKNEKLISSEIQLENQKHFFIQASKVTYYNKQYLYVVGRTVIYDNVEISLNFWAQVHQDTAIESMIEEIEYSIKSVKAINISPNGRLHHWAG